MKKVWVSVIPWNKEIALMGIESGVDALLIPEGYTKEVKKLGVIKTIAQDGDLKLGKEVIQFAINNKEDERAALQLAKSKTLIVKTNDWTIIPLENLIAQTQGLIAEVKSAREAKTAVQILERGVEGVLLNTNNINEIKKTVNLVKALSLKLNLEVAKIIRVETLGMGDRICIDTCTNMKLGEGILVGNSSSAMFLVHSESIKNPYVEPRPFRVNAGPVHAYTLLPEGKTKYLSELKSGGETLIVNHKGETQVAIIGRVKVEKRPLILVEGKIKEKEISLILQNAETVRLVTPEGNPISVVALKKGEEVLAYVEEAGRHFGIKIKETIVEK